MQCIVASYQRFLLFGKNADPSVRRDLERFMQRIAPDGDPAYEHDAEGPDDMPAHIRSVLTQNSVVIPVVGGRPALGTSPDTEIPLRPLPLMDLYSIQVMRMQVPLVIEFRNMKNSPALETRVRQLAAQLEKFSSQIIHCHVTIETPHRHHHRGNLFNTVLRITVPGHELAIRRASPIDHSHEDPYVAVRDAFKAARRRLQGYERERRGEVKTHAATPHGRICEIDRQKDFGRIETEEGRLVYFHRNSVLGRPFEELSVGTTVRFVEEPGDLGPQASTVHA